jgi:hypothetical protein
MIHRGQRGRTSLGRASGGRRACWRAAACALGAAACAAPGDLADDGPREAAGEAAPETPEAARGATDLELDAGAEGGRRGRAVGLALEVANGVGAPVHLRRGQRFYLDQLDVRAAIPATVDEGVDGLRTRGDFAGLPWQGVRQVDEEPVLLSNPDGTFTRRRFFRDAAWMSRRSTLTLEQLDDRGHALAPAVRVDLGTDTRRRERDSFFIRRLRAIQWTYDCASPTQCAGATRFEEEALLEVREATRPEDAFALHPRTAALRLRWSLRPGAPYLVPVTQIAQPTYAYGFRIDLAAVTPPRADGTYPPGSPITFRLTLRDGAGNRLHPQGSLPTYNQVRLGLDATGIQYYRAFFDPTTTYWRRKHRERMLMAELLGPAQHTQPLRSIIDLDAFLDESIDVQTTATLAADGMHAEFRTFPTANDLFGGAFDPAGAAWNNPVPDEWTHTIPADAPPGTYYVNVKGRRVYLGEDRPASTTLEIQVGTPQRTEPVLTTGPCDTCHSGAGALDRVLHANANRATCHGCHVPLGFELEGPISVRTHFIHSRSRRFDAPLARCASCHLTPASIQRTSKSACLSCHSSYPADHVAAFGPVQSMYVGGGRESFQQCTATCHTNHPNSQL